jgi:hypothetical protein
MADQSTTPPPPPDQTLPQILAALQSIAAAVTRGTELIVDAADERPASQEQSTAIVDYLVLRELVGRQFDELRRTVAATRGAGQQVEFDGAIPAEAVKVAVFTRRTTAPDEVADIVDLSSVDLRKRQGARRGSNGGGDSVPGFQLSVVTDDRPIVRLELRDAADLAVALGPRLASVT